MYCENSCICSEFKLRENAQNVMILSVQFLFLWKESGIKFLPFLWIYIYIYMYIYIWLSVTYVLKCKVRTCCHIGFWIHCCVIQSQLTKSFRYTPLPRLTWHYSSFMVIIISRCIWIIVASSKCISDCGFTTDFAILVDFIFLNRLIYDWVFREAINRAFNFNYMLQLV